MHVVTFKHSMSHLADIKSSLIGFQLLVHKGFCGNLTVSRIDAAFHLPASRRHTIPEGVQGAEEPFIPRAADINATPSIVEQQGLGPL
jgi:hypothetical protein